MTDKEKIADAANNMGKIQYGVFDSVGKLLRYFNTYKQAETFKISLQRYDWSVKQIWVK